MLVCSLLRAGLQNWAKADEATQVPHKGLIFGTMLAECLGLARGRWMWFSGPLHAVLSSCGSYWAPRPLRPSYGLPPWYLYADASRRSQRLMSRSYIDGAKRRDGLHVWFEEDGGPRTRRDGVVQNERVMILYRYNGALLLNAAEES